MIFTQISPPPPPAAPHARHSPWLPPGWLSHALGQLCHPQPLSPEGGATATAREWVRLADALWWCKHGTRPWLWTGGKPTSNLLTLSAISALAQQSSAITFGVKQACPAEESLHCAAMSCNRWSLGTARQLFAYLILYKLAAECSSDTCQQLPAYLLRPVRQCITCLLCCGPCLLRHLVGSLLGATTGLQHKQTRKFRDQHHSPNTLRNIIYEIYMLRHILHPGTTWRLYPLGAEVHILIGAMCLYSSGLQSWYGMICSILPLYTCPAEFCRT